MEKLYQIVIFMLLLSLDSSWTTSIVGKFCPETVKSLFYTSCTSCVRNEQINCPYNTVKISTGQGEKNCSFFMKLKEQSIRLTGCRHLCQREAINLKCCDGYWGDKCDACPGGGDNPCFTNGDCDEGREGFGTCDCKDGFSGTACERCANETFYGVNCTNACMCVNGKCNNGIHGDGSCECYSGFSGTLCDKDLEECENVTCSNNSHCSVVDGNTTCVCDVNYENEDLNGTCVAIDSCLSSPCHHSAHCMSTGPNEHTCTCLPNYSGDGIDCNPIDPCQVNYGKCIVNSSVCEYRSPNKSECICKVGFEGYLDGVGCSLIDVCTNKSVNCYPDATCTTVGPGRYQCICPSGYIGDGKNCYGNIMQTIYDLNIKEGPLQNQLHMSYRLLLSTYKEALMNHGPFTLFIPTDRGYKTILKSTTYAQLMNNKDFGSQIIRQHLILGQLSLATLSNHSLVYTLEGNTAELNFRARNDIFKFRLHGANSKTKVVKGNILASNGIIHVTNSLLTLQPEVKGDPQKSLLKLIIEEGRYNRFRTLIGIAGLDSMFLQDNITVFAPDNGAWDSLPDGSLEYLMSDQGKKRLKIILENHIFRGRMAVANIINSPVIKSLANFAISVNITNIGQIRLDNKVNISQTDIPSKNGIYHHIESVIIPASFGEIIPSRCDEMTFKVVGGPCGSCLLPFNLKCPDDSVQLDAISTGCRFWFYNKIQYVPIIGCQLQCNKTYTKNKCCSGFYGRECLPCRGGFLNPCGGNGKCIDGINGNGTCVCRDGFTGMACQYCIKKNVYGANCSQECSCLYGICDDGVKGSGKCKPNSCSSSHTGERCDLKKEPCGYDDSFLCHAHADCVKIDDKYRCVCKNGYDDVYGQCQEIDPCQKPDRGGCHKQATCTKVGPDMPKCDCNSGWIGDGFDCYPATPCSHHQDCHSNAECNDLEPGNFNCMCKSGFYGNGTYCAMSNTCLVNNGGCHFKAKCASTGPGKNNCTCDELYGGDGYTCYSSIAEEVKSHPNLTHLAQLMRNIDDNDNILSWLDSNYTFFAPTDDVMNKLLLEGDTGYWRNENNILTLLRFHTLTKEYNVDNLKQLSKYYSKFDTLFDGYSLSIAVKSDGVFILTNLADQAKIIEPDIPALNGFIHVIDKVLEPFLPDADLPDLEEFFTSNSQYSLFGQQLDQKDLLQFLEDMDEYTLFVPTNDVLWSINRTITKRFLQYYILPKIYLTAAFEDNQMITTVLGTDHRLHITFIDNKMFVNNVPIEDSNHLTVGGVVHGLSGILHPVINRCDQTYTNQTFGACVSCQQNFYPCPYNFKSRIPPVIMKNACTFTDIISGLNMIGCHTLCYYQKVTLECCNGYYGDKCNECPGGPEISCSGHGVCSDGIDGTGLCQCEDSFTGFKCHKCDVGLTGPGCNITINSCNYLNGNCSQHAVCQKVEGSVTCQCKPGFIGDGHTCQSPCDVHKNICDSHALCKYDSTNHSLSCECFEGYHGNGSWCKEIVNQCAVGNGGCSLYAQCMFEPPATTSLEDGMVNCECLKGYIGNGTLCNKDILNTLSQLPQVSNFYQAVKSVENTNLTKLLSNREGKITLFTPVNKVDDTKPTKDIDIQSLNYSTEDIRKYIVDFEAIYINTTLILTNNSYIPSLAGDILHITYNDRQFYVNGNRILEKNIPTLNGFIHLIEPPTSTVQLPVNTDNTLTSPTDLSVIIGPVVAVVIVLIIVIVVIVYYKRAKSTGFLNFMKRYKKDIDDSFTHLHGSSEDDSEPDPLQQPGNINYNPLYQSQVEEEFDN